MEAPIVTMPRPIVLAFVTSCAGSRINAVATLDESDPSLLGSGIDKPAMVVPSPLVNPINPIHFKAERWKCEG